MNDELENMWEEAVMAFFKVAPRHIFGGTEKNH
jgi:hypothetical protein